MINVFFTLCQTSYLNKCKKEESILTSSLIVIPCNHTRQVLETSRHVYPVCIRHLMQNHHVKMDLENGSNGVD
jgi:hypothetical protein